MSLIVVTVATGWTWPALAPIVLATAGVMGFRILTKDMLQQRTKSQIERRMEKRRTVTLPLDQQVSEPVSAEVDREERLAFEKDKIVLIFRKDVRGKFIVEVEGDREQTRMELRYLGEEFARTIIQQFAHHRVAQELEQRGILVVEEEVNEEGDIVLRTRRWK
ncbi:MAG: DUF1257 domain-containing protein [bacterium]